MDAYWDTRWRVVDINKRKTFLKRYQYSYRDTRFNSYGSKFWTNLSNPNGIVLEDIKDETEITTEIGSHSMKFAPLHRHTANIKPFKTTFRLQQPQYYYSKKQNKAYMITLMTETLNKYHICKYDIVERNIIKLTPKAISFIIDFKISIDNINEKLYLLSLYKFCVFDLKTNKWNLITTYSNDKYKISISNMRASYQWNMVTFY